MQNINLKNLEIGDQTFDKLTVAVDDDGNTLVLPLLWSVHLSRIGSVFKNNIGEYSTYPKKTFQPTNSYFQERPISDNTIANYWGCLFRFLKFINEQNKSNNSTSVHRTELVDSVLLNKYLNEYLPNTINSESSLKIHKSALTAYFSFLNALGLASQLHPQIYRKTNQLLAEKDPRVRKINYVPSSDISLLMRSCTSERDRLILRMGFEVGLRSQETTGLLLTDNSKKNGPDLIALFADLDQKPHVQEFSYRLRGKYAKRGKSRDIFFSRSLLTAMKHYFDGERAEAEKFTANKSNTLLLRSDKGNAGLPIGKGHASRIFCKLRKLYPHMNQSLSFHDLRHTFATNLYHQLLSDGSRKESQSENNALLIVSLRLGHKSITSTLRYIRLLRQVKGIEGFL